jgi:hypothetical protein
MIPYEPRRKLHSVGNPLRKRLKRTIGSPSSDHFIKPEADRVRTVLTALDELAKELSIVSDPATCCQQATEKWPSPVTFSSVSLGSPVG